MAKASISRRNAWRLQIGRARWRGGKFAADDECVLQHIDDTLHFERGCMKSAAPESPVSTRLAGGAKGIRTPGPTVNGADTEGRPTPTIAPSHHRPRAQLIVPASLFDSTWDREFESTLLQRRVQCEPALSNVGQY